MEVLCDPVGDLIVALFAADAFEIAAGEELVNCLVNGLGRAANPSCCLWRPMPEAFDEGSPD
jgi:hypothetical protein